MTENQRLKTFRRKLGYTQEEFSKFLGIKQGSYSDIERGKVGISSILLKNLTLKYRINPIWLYEGKGDMFIDEVDTVNESADSIYHNSTGERKSKSLTCESCEYLEKIIEAHLETIKTQQELIASLKVLLESKRNNG